METKEIALISVFAALWIAAEALLGPIVGRFSLGPVTMHGVINRVVGWMLMFVLVKATGSFGRVTLMALIASMATRLTRAAPIEALVVGLGYALGGFLFDVIAFLPGFRNLQGRAGAAHMLGASFTSGLAASAPYLLLKLFMLGPFGFIAALLIYTYSTLKGVIFSLVGTSLGFVLLPRTFLLYRRSDSNARRPAHG